MQNRVSNLHQILREMIDRAEASRLSRGIGAAALTAVLLSFVTIGAGWAAAEKSKRLSGSQIRAKFIGMQLTDEVLVAQPSVGVEAPLCVADGDFALDDTRAGRG